VIRFVTIFNVILMGCAAVDNPRKSLLSTDQSDLNYVAPYTSVDFQDVLAESKLQAPDSSTICQQSMMPGCSGWFFRLDDSGKIMTFNMSGDHHRSELRQVVEWKTSSHTWKKLIGEVHIPLPETAELEQITFAQIHDSESHPNKPLLRMVWIRSKDGYDDSLWAAVRLAVDQDQISWTRLGKRTDDFQKFEVKVKENLLKIELNNVLKVEADVEYWQDLSSYFKAGVYLQSPGNASVRFKSLKYFY
jgi:hypothetical protein